MNELIIWDKTGYMGEEDKVFFTLKELSDMGFHIHLDENGNTIIFELVDNDFGSTQAFLEHETFPYITKKDINNKKIYADCSIFEFDFKDCVFSYKEKGYFSYNSEFCCYSLICFDGHEYFLLNKHISNLKIIDTIQENKLGLIK